MKLLKYLIILLNMKRLEISDIIDDNTWETDPDSELEYTYNNFRRGIKQAIGKALPDILSYVSDSVRFAVGEVEGEMIHHRIMNLEDEIIENLEIK